MKKELILFGLLALGSIFTNCDKKEAELKSANGKQTGVKLAARGDDSTYIFVSGTEDDSTSYFEMTVSVADGDAEVTRSKNEVVEQVPAAYHFIGHKSIDNSEKNSTIVYLDEEKSYFFVPFNQGQAPVAIVKGGCGVQFWCDCNNILGATNGFCLTGVSTSGNSATVSCKELACIWCILKKTGIKNISSKTITNLGDLGNGTVIACDKLILDGQTYTIE